MQFDELRDEQFRHAVALDDAANALAGRHQPALSKLACVPIGAAPTMPQAPRVPSASTACDHFGPSGRFHREIGASSSDLLNRRDRIFALGVHGMRGAKLLGERKPCRHDIDRDDRCRADNARRHHRAQADAAGAEGSETLAGPDLQRVHHRTRAGLNAAAERSEPFQRRVLWHFDHRALMRERISAERGLAKKMVVHRSCAIVAHRGRAVLRAPPKHSGWPLAQ